MEDFVTFEIAKKLKENGFKEECFANYWSEDACFEKNSYHPATESVFYCYNNDEDLNKYYIDAPTISQALKWLRERKEIDVVIYPIDAGTVFMGGEKYILSIYINRKRDYKLHQDNKDKYVAWKEAALAGIEYVLDNLI